MYTWPRTCTLLAEATTAENTRNTARNRQLFTAASAIVMITLSLTAALPHGVVAAAAT